MLINSWYNLILRRIVKQKYRLKETVINGIIQKSQMSKDLN